MMFRLLSFLIFSTLVFACGDDSSESPQSSNSESTAAEESAAAPDEEAGEQAAAAAEEAAPPSEAEGAAQPAEGTVVEGEVPEGTVVAAPAPTGPHRNLFTDAEIRVGVSSANDTSAHGPAKMVDGDMDTYWSSAAGDAVGSWIGFRVPDGTGVSKIRIVGGHSGEGNAWASGPRIRKVEVFHNGASKGEFTLSGARPGFHDIEVEGVGGLWQVVVKSLTGNANAQATVSVAELQVIGATGEHSMTPYMELPERCRIGAVDGLFGEPGLSSEGLRAAGSRDLAPGFTYGGETPNNVDALYARLAQGTHRAATIPLRAVEFNAARNAGKVVFLLYGVDPNTPAQASARRSATRTGDEGKSCYQPNENFVQCMDMHIARFSLPRGGVPTYDGGVQMGGDTCSVSSIETTLRDMDGDDKAELLVEIQWQGTTICSQGSQPGSVVFPDPPRMNDELILNLDSAMSQFQSTLRSTAPFGELNLTRTMRDANGDGKEDIIVAGTTQRCVFEDAEGNPAEPQCTEEESSTTFLYVSHIDAWIPEGEEVPPPPSEEIPADPAPLAPNGQSAADSPAAAPSAPSAPAPANAPGN